MQRMMRIAVQFAVVMLLLASGNLMAQTGFGLRAGVTASPNQFHFGAHFVSDPLVAQLTFRPNLEIGVGDHVTTVAANFEFAYRIPVQKSRVWAYIGAGPALNIYKHSDDLNHDTHTGGGFNILLGLEHRKGLFGEVKVGALDSPDFKFTVGYTFR